MRRVRSERHEQASAEDTAWRLALVEEVIVGGFWFTGDDTASPFTLQQECGSCCRIPPVVEEEVENV
ncbi:unnamed protein product [Lota lota]